MAHLLSDQCQQVLMSIYMTAWRAAPVRYHEFWSDPLVRNCAAWLIACLIFSLNVMLLNTGEKPVDQANDQDFWLLLLSTY